MVVLMAKTGNAVLMSWSGGKVSCIAIFDGPTFKEAVKFSNGEAVSRKSFWFCDLLPE